ncbi:hypothetical protein NEH59_21000, partial [Xanthomonas hortorum pv. pelargonii]|uniref:hypothetical protein n=1 Tax=Xanthomonas hortorum TaxID=56454 RepID=UPI0020436A1A
WDDRRQRHLCIRDWFKLDEPAAPVARARPVAVASRPLAAKTAAKPAVRATAAPSRQAKPQAALADGNWQEF